VAAGGGTKTVIGNTIDYDEPASWYESVQAYSTKGQFVRALEDGTVTAIQMLANWVAGRTYRVGLYKMDQTAWTVLTTQTQEFVAPAGATRRLTSTAVNWTVERNAVYYLAVTDFSGTASLALPMSSPDSGAPKGTGASALLDGLGAYRDFSSTSVVVGNAITPSRNVYPQYHFQWTGSVGAGPQGPQGPAGDTTNMWKRWSGTQAAYDALGTYDPDTLYVVIG
jgi:hypothetical protein